ncbi:flagellar basal body rod protein FlgC [Planctomicrobium sp.]|jgi:flagellar basal-body rod protein FlgC|nr:flagellar basal body rod protein FlgC [Planctomicrobium sp.]MBT5020636.1 flagellar basal body rod protein FlgC [Planctomicrobium sp.]MDB4733515.1 flagellar basal body rod protein FlgC [Planctomicrobium sp.]
MKVGNVFAAAEISASGLKAERTRMEVAAGNIANANATRSPEGGPYRRQQVIFSAQMQNANKVFGAASSGETQLGGVDVVGVQADQSPLPKVYNPGHPDADEQGFVEMPNVALPMEMVDLMTASRSYEANLKSLETFRKMAEQTFELMRGR